LAASTTRFYARQSLPVSKEGNSRRVNTTRAERMLSATTGGVRAFAWRRSKRAGERSVAQGAALTP